MSDRFQVRSVTGYTIGREGKRASRVPRTTYWICDLEGYPKQVATFAPGDGFVVGDAARRRRAETPCADLNEWNRRELGRLA